MISGSPLVDWLEETRTLPVGEKYFPELEPVGDVTAHTAYCQVAAELQRAWQRAERFAHRVDLEEWRDRGWLHKIQDQLAYLLNEQL